jgi:hypothetical protein
MLFPPAIIDHIAQSTYWADRTIRCELAGGFIATENDYTSNLTATIRRQINARAIPSLYATSYVLKPSIERLLGADACIVLSNRREFKLCVFEAKWPRLSTHKDCWDSIQRSSGASHFDEQLARQAHFANAMAMWEMFYCEFPFGQQPSFMPSHVSACVWHGEAMAMSGMRANARTPWIDSELATLLSAHGTQIDNMIKEVCMCNKGKMFQGQDYMSAFLDFGIPRQVLVVKYGEQAGQDA